ncbi:transglycosylase domain-containing protein [Paenibacillus chungangensis]|uniref:Transglycosylase domain-containing protein n=1 Tax=Paenibacillus chungangensis TaxID=696535 RepID=A0ABW3HPE5_9BACL
MQEEQQQSRGKPRYSKWRLFGLVSFMTVKWLVYFGIFIGLLAGGAVTGYVAALVKEDEVRPRTVIENKVDEYAMTGYVYFNDGTLVGQLRTDEDRIVVSYEEIPESVKDALLATEDNNFMEHIGIDITGLGRAVKERLFNEDVQTGGSTITQQLARHVFLSLDQTDGRKAKEIFLSMRMERYLTKKEILTAYLNKMPFGNGSNGYQVHGIKAAAKGIFGVKDLNDLHIAQAAYLAGLPQLPSRYSAFTGAGKFNETGFERAMKRQQFVLKRMLETGRITQEVYDDAVKFDIRATIAPTSEKGYTTYPYLMLEAERKAAEVLLMKEDPSLTTEELRKPENADRIEEARQHLLRAGYHIHTTIDKEIYQIMRDIGSDENNFTPYSETKGLEQIAGMMIDHRTGAILGMLEGRDFYEEQMNFATQMVRQPGSTMKTIAAYLPGIHLGIVQPASIIDDAPMVMKDGQKGFHIPMNVTRKFRGLVTARDALNRSLNLPALKIYNEQVTIPVALEFVRELGITTLDPADEYSQTGVIGGLQYGTTVEELTNAYGSIANNGVFNDAYLIEKITDSNGKTVYDHEAKPKTLFSEQTAFLMTDMLRTVISSPSGSGYNLTREFDKYGKIPIAGKTGSTQGYGDVWFMGFSPDVTLGVWAGYEKQANSLTYEGRWRARKIWAKILNEVSDAKPEMFKTEQFDRPDGVTKATVSSASGLLPTALTRSAGMLVTDWFDKKHIPKKKDESLVEMKYITYEGINYVPNEKTPSEFLKQKVVIKRKKPLDELMDEIKAAQAKLPGSKRLPLERYLPADAENNAPSKTDPREDDGAPPTPPQNVKMDAADNGEVKITFTDSPSKDVVGYRVYRAFNDEEFKKLGESFHLGDNYNMPTMAKLDALTKYYVTAVDVVGKESEPSVILQFGSLPVIPESPDGSGEDNGNDSGNNGGDNGNGNGGETGNDNGNNGGGNSNGDSSNGGDNNQSGSTPVPSAPTGVTAVRSDLSVTISWSANSVSDQVVQYNVYFKEEGGSKYSRIAFTSQTSFEHVAPLTAGTYYITAENDEGVSERSATVSIQ